MNEELKAYILALGGTQEHITALTKDRGEDEAPPETATIIKEAKTGREEFWRKKLTPEIEKAYDERTSKDKYLDAIKPLQNRLERMAIKLGVESSELKGEDGKPMDIKKMFTLVETRQSEALEKAGTENSKDLRSEIEKLRGQIGTINEERETERAAHEEALKAERSRIDQAEITNVKKKLVRDLLDSEEFKDMKKIGNVDRYVDLLLEEADLDFNVSDDRKSLIPVSRKDRMANPIRPGSDHVYKDPKRLLYDVLDANEMFPKHNGGGGTNEHSVDDVTIQGKKVDMGSVSFLEGNMD